MKLWLRIPNLMEQGMAATTREREFRCCSSNILGPNVVLQVFSWDQPVFIFKENLCLLICFEYNIILLLFKIT